MARKSGGKEKGRKARGKPRVPGMTRDATTVGVPSPGNAGSSNMMDRVISSVTPPTRMRMVVSQNISRKKGKPVKSRRKT